MKLNQIPKEELELLSYTEIAQKYLEENKKTMNTADLFREICNLLELSESEYVDKIADFFGTLTTSKEFILLEDGTWDLKSKHKIKVVMEEIYDDSTSDELEDELDEDIVEMDEEPDDLDAINDDESYIDDDSDDELADLTIVNDDELEDE